MSVNIEDIINGSTEDQKFDYDPSHFGYTHHEAGDEPTPRDQAQTEVDDLLDLVQIKTKALAIERTFLADGWIQAGHLSVLSGREKRGKSTCVYDLITALITGQKWMDFVQCQQSPVLLLDFENPADYVWYNLDHMLDQRGAFLEEVAPYYGQIDPDMIRKTASPLAVEYAIDRIERMKRRLKTDQPGIMFIDTAAPAFMSLFDDPNWTNSNTQVRNALEIGQEVARRSGWHVMVIYHDNKSGSGAAGSYEWYGTPDVFLRFERELDDPKGYLSIFGRLLAPPDPIEFVRRDHLLRGQQKGSEAASTKRDEGQADFIGFVDTLPHGRPNARHQAAIVDDARKSFKLSNGSMIGKNKVVEFLNRAEEIWLVQTHQEAANKPKFYWVERVCS